VIAVELSRPYSLPVEGQLALDVEPDTGAADANIDRADPAVRLAHGGRLWNFRIPPGETRIATSIPTTGTVASTVTVRIPRLLASGVAMRLLPAPRQFRVQRDVPAISAACYTKRRDGIEIRADGFSTTRNIDQAVLTREGLAEPVRVHMAGTSDSWFAGDLSIKTGGAFAVTFSAPVGDQNWSLSFLNSEGTSEARPLRHCE
jgi:hypothetical protein